MLESYLNKLKSEIKVTFSLLNKGIFNLNIGKYFIKIKENNNNIYCVSYITKIPDKNREDLFVLLMRANFLGQATGKNMIGIDQDEKFFTLSLSISIEKDYVEFKNYLETFLNYLSYWEKTINNFKKQ